jgi:hypothetical protein
MFPLFALTACLSLPASGETPWPIDIPLARTEQVDLDGDGVLDEKTSGGDGGSGYRTWATCVRHGASGHVACQRFDSTPYALFSGFQRVFQPQEDNQAEALLGSASCASPDPASPAQGAMWALLQPLPELGRAAPTLRWMEGPPVEQENVCLGLEHAARFPGGWAWDPSGGELMASYDHANWRAWFSANWHSISPIGSGPFDKPGPELRRSPIPITNLGELEIYQLAHALAIHDPARDRHAWFANFGRPWEAHKLDRWGVLLSIGSPTASGLVVNWRYYTDQDARTTLFELDVPPTP